jgi:serine/threonine protein kinase
LTVGLKHVGVARPHIQLSMADAPVFAALPSSIPVHGRLGSSVHGIVREAAMDGTPATAKAFFALHSPDSFGIAATTLTHLSSLLLADLKAHWESRHPNIVQLFGVVYDSFRTPIWIVTERPDATLTALLRSARQASPALVTALARDVFAALSFLHARGVVHGNIKPSNVSVTRCSFQLTDFGSGAFRSELAQLVPLVPPYSLYTAPEEILIGCPASAAGDVYAAGLVLAHAAAVIGSTKRDGLPALTSQEKTDGTESHEESKGTQVEPATLSAQHICTAPPPDPRERGIWANVTCASLPEVAPLVMACVQELPSARAAASSLLSLIKCDVAATRAAVAAAVRLLLAEPTEASTNADVHTADLKSRQDGLNQCAVPLAAVAGAMSSEPVAYTASVTLQRQQDAHASVDAEAQTEVASLPTQLAPQCVIEVSSTGCQTEEPPAEESVGDEKQASDNVVTQQAQTATTEGHTAVLAPACATAPALAQPAHAAEGPARAAMVEAATQTDHVHGDTPAPPTALASSLQPPLEAAPDTTPPSRQAGSAERKTDAFIAGLAAMDGAAVDALLADPDAIGTALTRLAEMTKHSGAGLRVLIEGLSRSGQTVRGFVSPCIRFAVAVHKVFVLAHIAHLFQGQRRLLLCY